MITEKTDRKTKLANLANLPALLREVETEYGDEDDLQDLRSQLVSAMRIYRTSRYKLGQSLYAYRSALPHGARLPVVRAIAESSGIADRTIREIVADYERFKDTPASVVVELEKSGIDPAAKSKLIIVSGAVRGHRQGQTPAQAVQAAVSASRPRLARGHNSSIDRRADSLGLESETRLTPL
jgi:hypothetical protein